MDIVIIGTGNTATVLGRKLKAAGHSIVQIFGRDAEAASSLAYKLGTESTNYWSVVSREADIYLLAVSDIAIEELRRELQLGDKTVVHTAASVSKNILKDTSSHFGVFYPLQSLKKSSANLPEIPVIIDASDPETLQLLEGLAGTISENVVQGDDEYRLKMHLAAVFCNNFTNHIYALMESYCGQHGIDFKLLIPLIQETAMRLNEMSPVEAQTGPAIRRDATTIAKHLELLQNDQRLKDVYELLTRSIQYKGA
ncbi:MAG: hypothetical protein JWP69_1008 [Flaviaesturariibacter sp.]|nr:hypothetical protein [Flaviaesturariibacter sp.]